jgi:hypothetical protein
VGGIIRLTSCCHHPWHTNHGPNPADSPFSVTWHRLLLLHMPLHHGQACVTPHGSILLDQQVVRQMAKDPRVSALVRARISELEARTSKGPPQFSWAMPQAELPGYPQVQRLSVSCCCPAIGCLVHQPVRTVASHDVLDPLFDAAYWPAAPLYLHVQGLAYGNQGCTQHVTPYLLMFRSRRSSGAPHSSSSLHALMASATRATGPASTLAAAGGAPATVQRLR